MVFVGTWNDQPIGISDKRKDLEFYMYDIRGLSTDDSSIMEINEEMIPYMDFFNGEGLDPAEGLWLVSYEGIKIPQFMLEVISYDLQIWKSKVQMLLMSMIEFTRIMRNSDTIEDIKPLLDAILVIDKVASNSDKVFDKIGEESLLTHPALTCGFNQYNEYRETYFTMNRLDREYHDMMNLSYT